MNPLEILVGGMFESIFGNPLFFALFMLLFIFGLIIMMRISIEGGIVVIIPAFLWLVSSIEILLPIKVLLLLGIGFIFAFMLIRVMRH